MHIAKQKSPEKPSEGSSPEPGPNGIEQDFTVAVRVSFPSTDFIVNRKRDLLLELVLMIRSVSSDPIGALKPKAHVEILGNVIFRLQIAVSLFLCWRNNSNKDVKIQIAFRQQGQLT